ncbi:MAG TPA: alpha/beta hydrolase, partial [Cytophagales bacterium]|nr:alpha/beta hydrolase [Cytophagales bacterium]
PPPPQRESGYLEQEALEVLPTLIKALGISQPVVYGHSDGGSIALIYAAHHATRALVTEAAHVKVEAETLAGIRQAQTMEQLPAKLSKYHGPKAHQLVADWIRIWLAEGYRDWSIEALLPQITCPTLVLQGAQDEYASTQHMYDIAEQIGPQARALLVEEAGHELHREAPEQVLAAASQFIMEALA